MGYKRVSKLEQLIRLEVRMVRLMRLNDQITYMSAMRSSRVGIPSRWAEVDRILSSMVPEGVENCYIRGCVYQNVIKS